MSFSAPIPSELKWRPTFLCATLHNPEEACWPKSSDLLVRPAGLLLTACWPFSVPVLLRQPFPSGCCRFVIVPAGLLCPLALHLSACWPVAVCPCGEAVPVSASPAGPVCSWRVLFGLLGQVGPCGPVCICVYLKECSRTICCVQPHHATTDPLKLPAKETPLSFQPGRPC